MAGFVLMAILVQPLSTSAQYGCDQPLPDAEQEQLPTACGVTINYAPVVPDQTPIKYVRISFHVMQRDDGTGSFQNNVADSLYLHNLVMAANSRLANLGPLNIGSSPYIPDTRVRMFLERIYYHPHAADTAANADLLWKRYVIQDLDGYGITPDDTAHVEHVFLVTPYGTGGGRTSDIGEQKWIVHSGWYRHYLANGPMSYTWGITGNFVHEFGHACGLLHNFHNGPPGADCFDLCTDDDPVGQPCPIQATSNNYMDYFPGGYNSSNPDPGFSECQMGRMHYYLDGQAGTIERAVLRDYCTYDPNAAMDITSDALWLSGKKLKSDLIVHAGATLTVKCRVHLPIGARVIIEPQGRLVLDGGVLTNLCADQWRGVEVQGSSTHDQFGGALATYQGKLELKNGAVIENAEVGAVACTRDANGFYDLNGTGGIIKASNSTFRNCKYGVVFFPYEAHNGNNQVLVNLSSFTGCTFSVDGNYPGTYDFKDHVLMAGTYGTHFRNCHFENLRQDSEVSGSADLGVGIRSWNAKYYVEPTCAGGYLEPGHVCVSPERSSFTGLDMGIYAANTNARNFTVSATDFTNNICGVHASGVVNPVITGNHFVMGGRQYPATTAPQEDGWNGMHRAIFTTESYATRIDDNTIEPDPNAQSQSEGIVVGFCRDHNDVVFRNTVSGMVNGYVGEGINADPGNQTHVGLTWLCNANNGNNVDLYNRVPVGIILPGDVEPNTVRLIQGANDRPSDNTFDRVAPTPAEGDIKSTNDQNVINYRYRQDGGSPQYDPIGLTENEVSKQPSTTVPAQNCANRILLAHVIGDHPSGTLVDGMNVLTNEKLAYGNTRYLYDQLIDGGNHDEVVQEIMESWPEDAWTLRTALLARSPYLSTGSLMQVATHNTLPAAMFTEVCVANPEATQRQGFLPWLQDRSGHPLPDYLAGLIVASWDDRTYRSTLESTMAGHHTNMSMAADLLVEAYQNDTVSEPLDSLRLVWQHLRTKGARYAEAWTEVEAGDLSAAESVIEGIPEELDLKGAEELERQRMLALIDFLHTVHNSGRNEAQLTPAEISTLEGIIGGAYDRPATWAQNLLCYWYDHCRAPLTGGDDRQPRRFTRTAPAVAAPPQPRLWAQPNPASQYTELCYELVSAPKAGTLVVRDMAGREVVHFRTNGTQGRLLWDTREVEPGTYMAELIGVAELLMPIRVVVKH